jgi:hypothetical protein
MAITFTLEMPGITAAQLDAVLGDLGVGPGHAPDGQIAHVEVVTDAGATITDVWDSEEAFGRFMQGQLGPLLAKHGFPELAPPAMAPVHRVFVAEIGAAAR